MRSSQLDLGAAQRVVLDTAAGPIAALQTGSSAAVVLLVPGYTGSKEDFAPLLAPIAAAGYQAVAIDLPGQFESPGPSDPAGYTPAALAGAVSAAAAALGPAVHLVGHSFGGLVSRAALIDTPEAFRSLVLMGSGPASLGGARRARIDALKPVLATYGLAGVYAAAAAQEAAAPGFVAPPAELGEFLRRRFVEGSPAMLEGMGEAILVEPDRVAELAAVDRPMLVLHGAGDDAWVPAVQADMAQRLGARYVIIADAAHSPAVENPGPTAAALIDFWASLAPLS